MSEPVQLNASDDVFRLDGEVAVITGGGSGLGLGIARCMSQAGAQVVLVGRREAALNNACNAIGKQAIAEPLDVRQFDEVDAMVARVSERVGPISILVNNAGNYLKRAAIETD